MSTILIIFYVRYKFLTDALQAYLRTKIELLSYASSCLIAHDIMHVTFLSGFQNWNLIRNINFTEIGLSFSV